MSKKQVFIKFSSVTLKVCFWCAIALSIKFHKEVKKAGQESADTRLQYLVHTSKDLEKIIPNHEVVKVSQDYFTLKGSEEQLESWQDEHLIKGFQPFQVPIAEGNIPSHDLSINAIDWFKSTYELNGEGLLIGLKENAADTSDIDLKGKFRSSSLVSPIFDTHATTMATIIAGWGNSSLKSLGVASEAELKSSSFANVLPDNNAFLDELVVQNHSYGFDIQNEYDLLAEAYDKAIANDRSTLHVFSAGNLGTEASSDGPYQGIVGFANLSGGLKQAKNTLVVGSTTNEGHIEERSSKGPAYDGRVKPEIVAYGAEGTSAAAALVSGSAALLTQQFQALHGEFASNDLLKAIMIASAMDIGQKGPDFKSGFGALDMFSASRVIANDQTFQAEVEDQEEVRFSIELPDQVRQLRVALVWNDLAANPGNEKALVNDLDLYGLLRGDTIRPLVLDVSPDPSTLDLPAQPGTDRLNNVELLVMDEPVQGPLQLFVDGAILSSPDQSFSIAYSFTYIDDFEWLSPNSLTEANVGDELTLNFHNSFLQEGSIEVRRNGGEWLPIASTEDELLSYVFDEAGDFRFRTVFGTKTFESQVLMVRQKIDLQKLFECGNELLFSWNDINAEGYEVLRIDSDNYQLAPFMISNDTTTFLNTEDDLLSIGYIKIKPIDNGSKGKGSSLYHFSNDGIGCFVKNWSATKNQDEIALAAELTTNWNVRHVEFLKVLSQDTTILSTQSASDDLLFNTVSEEERNAYYQYFTRLTFETPINGKRSSLTDGIEIGVIVPDQTTIFPNPVPSGEDIFFLGRDDISRIRLFDLQGTFASTVVINSDEQAFSLKGIVSGIYFYQLISLEEELVGTGRIIIE